MKTVDIGGLGEKIAEKLLKQKGYHIVARNSKQSYNELDIVALDGNDIVFAEVKTRSVGVDLYSRFGSPASAVDRNKRAHLIAAATQYLRTHPKYYQKQPRFDVIEIYLEKGSIRVLHTNHIINAFGRR